MVEGVLEFCKQDVCKVREVRWAFMFAEITPLPECPKCTCTKSALKDVGGVGKGEGIVRIPNKSSS